MKNDKKKNRIRYLSVTTFLLALIIVGTQLYFLKVQFDNTNRLTQTILDESLTLSISKYQADQLYANYKNFQMTTLQLVIADSTKKDFNIDSLLHNKDKDDNKFSIEWSSDQENNATQSLNQFLMLANRGKLGSPLNLHQLDSTYRQTLISKGLDMLYDMQLVDVQSKEIVAQTNPSVNPTNSSLYESPLFPITYDQSVKVLHKNPNIAVLKQMLGIIIGSAVMLIFIICLLLYYLYVISKQKKIEAIREDFVNSMTHELRNPLQSAISLSEMLKNDSVAEDKPMLLNVTERIQKSLHNLKTQVDTLLILSLSDKQQTKIEVDTNNLGKMLEDIANTYILIAKKPTSFSLEISPTPCLCRYSAIHFRNAIINLVENAIKYSGNEVRITITAILKDGMLSTQVKDNGIGISKENLPHIFEQYYRVLSSNKNMKGFGLGLSYVKWVAEAHGGTVSAESKENMGSVFTIEIPA